MAVFSPGAIVIAYVIAEDLAQGEPGVAGALANAAVGDDRLAAVHPDCGVDLAQLVGGFEGAVGGDGRAPGHIDRTGNIDRKSTRLNSSHVRISYAVFCLK